MLLLTEREDWRKGRFQPHARPTESGSPGKISGISIFTSTGDDSDQAYLG